MCLLEADKGRATCIISRKQVHEVVAQELNKPERYRKLTTDTIKQSRAAISKKLAELKLKDLITKQEHSSLKPNVPKTPKARLILKIHKDLLKIRLIINTQNSPIDKIAKKISKELRPLIRGGKSYTKDTKQFVDKIRNIKIEKNETMIIFDISDMYPSLTICYKLFATFVITKYDKIETLDELNKFNCKVQFTYESTTNNTLPFLDCLIKRDNEGRLQTKVYRKKTHTGQYMHYTSNQPEHVKIGTIKTLVRRAKIVCSTEESLTDELDYIKKTMRLNGYPEKLITKTIKQTLSYNSKSKNSQNLEAPKLFIPYEKGISEQLKRVANKYGLEVIFRRSLSLKSKLQTNPFKSDSTCGVVYKVTCSCCKKYFGETGRTAEEKIKEHQVDVNNEKI